MTGRILTIATVLTLSASLASAEQARQRWPGSSQGGDKGSTSAGGQSSGGQSSGGQSSGGQSSGGRSSAGERSGGQSSGGQSSGGSSAGPAAPRLAVPRMEVQRMEATPPPRMTAGAPRRESAPPPTPAAEPAPVTVGPGGGPVRSVARDDGQRIAQPRERAPRPEDLPRRANVAVPRGPVVVDNSRHPRNSSAVYIPPARIYTSRVYSNYYYYPRHVYPYGYGSFGLGYFYYDPYTWYDPYPAYTPYPAYSYPYSYGLPTGEIRLQVRPRHADVYVDGYYAGRVDDFDGFIQALRLEEGPHTIEIVAPGYETLVFSVRIQAGRKIEYRQDMRPY